MTFEQRVRVIKAWIKRDILTRFNPPNGLDPVIAIEDVVKAVNGKLPSNLEPHVFNLGLERITADILGKSKTRSLPAASIFQQSALTVAQSLYEPRTEAVGQSDTPTYMTVAAARIRAGNPVGEFYIHGNGAEELIGLGLVTREDITHYLH